VTQPGRGSGTSTAAAVVNAAARRAIVALADDARVQRAVRRHGMRLGAGRFASGETPDDAVGVIRHLNVRGLAANTTPLGEGVRDRAESEPSCASTSSSSTASRRRH
jgi:hypothetical protein